MRSMLRLLLILFFGLLFSSPEAEAFGVRPIDVGYDLGGNRTYVGYGALTYQAAYEAFGRHGDTASSQEWGSSADRQRANTKEEDPTGLLNEGFRYRDLDGARMCGDGAPVGKQVCPQGWLYGVPFGPGSQQTGAFITRDPLGFVDGPNLYTYVVQNPWTYYDPLGLYSFQEYKQDFSRGLDFINDNILANPRVQGGLQALGGAAEMGVAAYGTAQTAGLGSIPLAGLAVHGFDNFQTGVRQAWTGEQTNSLLQTAVLDFGGSQELADKVQMGSDVLAMGAEFKLLSNAISVNRAARAGEAGAEVVGDAARKSGFHATHPDVAPLILQNGFRQGTAPGRLGSGGTYVNNTRAGAIAEFQHHNPGVTPQCCSVKRVHRMIHA